MRAGLPKEATNVWATDGGKEAVVLWLREGARGGGEHQLQGAEGAKLWAAVGGEEALMLWLREGARGGRELEAHRWLEAYARRRLLYQSAW